MMNDSLALLIDQQLPAATRGDREAFARLVDGTRSVVASIALAIIRDAELSRDVAQDVFLAAWRDLGQLRDPHSFLPWLRQLTRHRAYHVLRTERRRTRRVTSDDADVLLARAVDDRPAADDRLVADEDRRILQAVLDALPDDTREVVTLFYREGRSSTQVAELLGLSDAAVRKRLSRARSTLRTSLLDHFGRAAQASAPGAAFTGAVMTALSISAPAMAATSTGALGVGAAAGTTWGLAQVGTLAGWLLLPAAGGLTGVLLGTRQLRRQARCAHELTAVRRFEAVNVALVLAVVVAFPLGQILTGSAWAALATFGAFIAALAALHLLWLPRIVAERHALEAHEHPEAAALARARERRMARLGWALGLLGGTAGLIAGLWLS